MAKKKNQATILRTLLLVTAIFAVSALAMAGLLQYYAKAVGTVNVQQSVVLSDGTNEYGYTTDYTITVDGLYGGDTHTKVVFIVNRASKDANVEFNIKVTDSKNNDVTDEFTVELRVSDNTDTSSLTEAECTTQVNLNNPLTIEGRKARKLCIDITPAINQIPDTYTVTVTVVPAQSQ